MSNFCEILVDMGFSKSKAEKALNSTGNMGIEAAMEWILTHEGLDSDEPMEDNIDAAGEVDMKVSEIEGSIKEPELVAKSLKCDDCGKIFDSAEKAEYHASKTKHSNFSESTEEMKPLTQEEKQEQLKRVQEILKNKRLEREEKERKEQLAQERSRRRTGQDILQAKQKFEEAEKWKIVQERKRDKEEELKARQKIKAEIEKDKLERQSKFAASQASASNLPVTATIPERPVAAGSNSANIVSKDYKESRLQIRFPNGDRVQLNFKTNELLAAVRLFVQINHSDQCPTPFTFATTFPNRTFTESDMQTTLSNLGLVPSAVLMITKC